MGALASTTEFPLLLNHAPIRIELRGRGAFPQGKREKRVAAKKRSTREDDVSSAVPRDDSAWEQRCAARARKGDSGAFEELIERYTARIYTHLFRLVRNREEAEDLTQETFLRVHRFFDGYDTSKPFRNWIYTIATNVGMNALRAQRRRTALAEKSVEANQGGMQDRDSDSRRLDAKERVAQVVGRLPARSALLVQLHYREGMTIREAAETIGINEGAAKVALHRARKEMREWLEEDMKNDV